MEHHTSDNMTTGDEASGIMNSLLKEHFSSQHVSKTVSENSDERKHDEISADVDSLSKKERKKNLEDFLSRRLNSKRGVNRDSISVVTADTKRILEEFLEAQLLKQSVQTNSHRYQRRVELDVTENISPSGESSGYNASQSNLDTEDSIPFVDDTDYDIKRAESLPEDDLKKTGIDILHRKSKSAPYQGRIKYGYINYYIPKAASSVPPAAPGTPHSVSESGSCGLKSFSVPYTGKYTNSSVSPSIDSLDIAIKAGSNIPHSTDSLEFKSLSLEKKHSPHNKPSLPDHLNKPSPADAPACVNIPAEYQSIYKSSSPSSDSNQSHDIVRPKMLVSIKTDSHKNSLQERPGTESSSDTEHVRYSYSHGRKKKSWFKKTRDRIQVMLNFKPKKPSGSVCKAATFRSEDGLYHVINPKKSLKNNKHNNDEIYTDAADVFEKPDEGPVVEEKHIHINKRIHQTHTGDGKHNVLRTEHSVEIIDVETAEKKNKHIEAQWDIQQSIESKGFMKSVLRRFSLRDRKRNTVKLDHRKTSFSHVDGRTMKISPHGSFALTQISPTKIDGNTANFHGVQITSKDVRRNSSHIEITDHEGKLLETVYFKNSDEENLPRNQSFEYMQNSYIKETKIDDHGKVKIIRETKTKHTQMELVENSEQQDIEKQFTGLDEAEKDQLYTEIVKRLTKIGDQLMIEEQIETASASKLSGVAQKSSSEEEVTPCQLTPLEKEIRDELRKYADILDDKLAKQVALQVAGIITYERFKEAVKASVGNGVGWKQLSAVFHLTTRAIKFAGASGALAGNIKEMSLQYIADTFAGWIVKQGGWDSMLSDNEDGVQDA